MAYRPDGARSLAVGAYGSVPSAQSVMDTAATPAAASASGRSSSGTINSGSRAACNTSIVSRSVIAVGRYPVK